MYRINITRYGQKTPRIKIQLIKRKAGKGEQRKKLKKYKHKTNSKMTDLSQIISISQ